MYRNLVIIPFFTLLLVFSGTAETQTSSLELVLHQDLLTQIVRTLLPHRETHNYRGSVDLGITRRDWNIVTHFTIHDMSFIVGKEAVQARAKVQVNNGELNYTSFATGKIIPRVRNNMLVLELSDLKLPLYVEPFGVRIDLGSVPANDFLPAEIQTVTVNLNTLAVSIEAHGKKPVRVHPARSRVILQAPNLILRADIVI